MVLGGYAQELPCDQCQSRAYFCWTMLSFPSTLSVIGTGLGSGSSSDGTVGSPRGSRTPSQKRNPGKTATSRQRSPTPPGSTGHDKADVWLRDMAAGPGVLDALAETPQHVSQKLVMGTIEEP